MKRLLVAFTIVTVLLMALASTALAATKTLDFRTDVSSTIPNFLGLCGGDSSGDITIDGWAHLLHWDNGQQVLKNNFSVTVTDSSSTVIGKGRQGLFVRRLTPPPFNTVNDQFNRVVVCTDGTVEQTHFGFTVDASGELHVHAP